MLVILAVFLISSPYQNGMGLNPKFFRLLQKSGETRSLVKPTHSFPSLPRGGGDLFGLGLPGPEPLVLERLEVLVFWMSLLAPFLERKSRESITHVTERPPQPQCECSPVSSPRVWCRVCALFSLFAIRGPGLYYNSPGPMLDYM